MLGDDGQTPVAAGVEAGGVGAAHQPYPVGITAKGTDPEIAGSARAGALEDVQGGAEEHVDAQGRKLTTGDGAYVGGEGGLPGGANGHGAGQFGEAAADLAVGRAIPFLVGGDEEGNRLRRRQRGWGWRRVFSSDGFGDEGACAEQGQSLQLVGKLDDLAGHGAAPAGNVVVFGQKEDAAHVVVENQLGDVARGLDAVAGKGDKEKLAHPLVHRHALHQGAGFGRVGGTGVNRGGDGRRCRLLDGDPVSRLQGNRRGRRQKQGVEKAEEK